MTTRFSNGFQTNPRQRQSGMAAVEFALVFALLFFAMYGIVTFGVVLYTQQVVSRSAEDGARVVLRLGQNVQKDDARVRDAIYDALASALITPSGAGTSLEQKKEWLRTTMQAQAPEITPQPPEQILVRVTYPYSAVPILPSVGPWTSWMPTQIIGKATAMRPAS